MLKKDLEKKVIALKNLVYDLDARHDKAIDALASLAAGYGVEEKKSQWHHSMMRLAKLELAAISKMRLRR